MEFSTIITIVDRDDKERSDLDIVRATGKDMMLPHAPTSNDKKRID